MTHSKKNRQSSNVVNRLLPLIMLSFLLASAGCQKDKAADSGDGDGMVRQIESAMTASEVIDRMKRGYRNAGAYQDQGSLHLSYRLQGSYLEEPHLWEVDFQRDHGLKVDVFEARIRADARQLACFIYDFGSANLDNQWQVHPINAGSLPIRRMFQDGICRHYITGQDDLPINQSNQDAAEMFFPPTVGLLTGQMTQNWLLDGTASRLSDEAIDGNPCFQIQVIHEELSWIVFVDAESFLLRRIVYPGELLDSRLQDNPDVENLEVVANFNQATFEPTREVAPFELKIPKEAKTVSHFVAVPEPFPSANVGKKIAELDLRDTIGQSVSQADWKGKVTLLWWPDSTSDEEPARKAMEDAFSELSVKEYNFARIEVFEGMLPGNSRASDRLRDVARQNRLPVIADFGFSAGRALGLDHFPALAVIDRQGVLQYVKSMEDEPLDLSSLKAVLVRVRSGDDVADEMRREYESFLDLYRNRLANARTDVQVVRDDGKLTLAEKPSHIKVRKQWQNDQVQQPGNILVGNDDVRTGLTILDGWRSVIRMDRQGNQRARKILDLDSRESISIVRGGHQQKSRSIVYSVMGQAVRVLDQDLKTIRTIQGDDDKQRIRDANLFDFDQDGSDELLVSWTGNRGTEVLELEQTNAQPRQIFPTALRSSTVVSGPGESSVLVFCDENGQLRKWSGDDGAGEPIACDLIAVTSINARNDANGVATLCAVGTDRGGQWTAIGLDPQFRQTWSVPIGSQRFQTQIESIAYAHLPGSRAGIWAIAATDGSIKLIGDDGKLVDNWSMGSQIHGIQLVISGNDYLAIISTDGMIQGWSLSAGGSIQQASSGR